MFNTSHCQEILPLGSGGNSGYFLSLPLITGVSTRIKTKHLAFDALEEFLQTLLPRPARSPMSAKQRQRSYTGRRSRPGCSKGGVAPCCPAHKSYIQIFVAGSIFIAKNWKQSKCTVTDTWVNKMWNTVSIQWNITKQ